MRNPVVQCEEEGYLSLINNGEMGIDELVSHVETYFELCKQKLPT